MYGKTVKKMKDIKSKLLFELLKNSKRSDRELAKVLGVSQPTITRRRKELEKTAIEEYTIIPKWEKFGYEIAAFTFFRIAMPLDRLAGEEERKRRLGVARKWLMEHPNIVFAKQGEGMGMNVATISFHKSYTDYMHLLSEFRQQWIEILQDVQSFVVSLAEGVMWKPLSLRYLADVIQQ